MDDLPDGATCERLTAEKLTNVFPKASEDRRKALAEELDAVIGTGGLGSMDRLIHFLGQAAIEMGPRANAKESFYYSVDALLELDDYKKHPEQAVTEGYIKDEQGNFIQNPNEEAIANHKYDSTNGNNTPGDGWLFAGRGLFHTTGRYNYNRLTKLYQRFFGEAQDFELHPELLEEPKYSVRAAVVFWLDHKMYRIADQGIDQETFNKIRKVINPGEGKDRKQQQWETVQALRDSGAFDHVCEFSVSRPSFDTE